MLPWRASSTAKLVRSSSAVSASAAARSPESTSIRKDVAPLAAAGAPRQTSTSFTHSGSAGSSRRRTCSGLWASDRMTVIHSPWDASPTGKASAKDTRSLGLKPSVKHTGRPLRRKARSTTRPKSRWPRKRASPSLERHSPVGWRASATTMCDPVLRLPPRALDDRGRSEGGTGRISPSAAPEQARGVPGPDRGPVDGSTAPSGFEGRDELEGGTRPEPRGAVSARRSRAGRVRTAPPGRLPPRPPGR